MLINLWIYIYAYNNHFYVCNNLYVILNMHQLLCNDKFLRKKYENIVFNDKVCWLLTFFQNQSSGCRSFTAFFKIHMINKFQKNDYFKTLKGRRVLVISIADK
jgi:hypothetical protein